MAFNSNSSLFIEKSNILNEYWHRTKNATSSNEGHTNVSSKLFSGILKACFVY